VLNTIETKYLTNIICYPCWEATICPFNKWVAVAQKGLKLNIYTN